MQVWKEEADPPMVITARLTDMLADVVARFRDAEGKVDYAALHDSERFRDFQLATCELQAVDFVNMPPDTRKAFCFNLYNMLVVHAYGAVGVPESIAGFYPNIRYRIQVCACGTCQCCRLCRSHLLSASFLCFGHSIFFNRAQDQGSAARGADSTGLSTPTTPSRQQLVAKGAALRSPRAPQADSSILHPNTILKTNPNPNLSLVLTLPLALTLTLTRFEYWDRAGGGRNIV